MFGPHLIIDGSKCDTAKLGDRLLIERILTEFPRAIGMTRIGGPYMFEYQAPDPAYSGVSGLVVIAESHIAIHTFPALDYFTMDIFSCKNFDHEVAIAYIKEALGVHEMDRVLVQRGLSFHGPHHGPLGATDELIEAAKAREHGLVGQTIGTIPHDDPLYPQEARMLWPAYGLTPDYGTYEAGAVEVAGGARQGARVLPANAAAAGIRAPAGMQPVQPAALNPTASTSGLLDRLATMGRQGRMLGKALARWEQIARQPEASVILALGPEVIADGMRDMVAELLHRGHVAALVLEGDALLADAYEALGFRHYLREDDETAPPARSETEWESARAQLTRMMRNHPSGAGMDLARALGDALGKTAPRPGILSTAAACQIPIFLAGDAHLGAIGLAPTGADLPALRALLAAPQAFIIVAGATVAAALSALLAEAGTVRGMAIDATPFPGAEISVAVDASLALPLLATGLVQRVPRRVAPVPPSHAAPSLEAMGV